MLELRIFRASFGIAIVASAACGRGLPAVGMPIRPATGPVVVVANQDHGVATIVALTEWRLVAHVDVDMNPRRGGLPGWAHRGAGEPQHLEGRRAKGFSRRRHIGCAGALRVVRRIEVGSGADGVVLVKR